MSWRDCSGNEREPYRVLPGSHRSRITYRREIRVVRAVLPARIVAARPESSKRDAIEAELRTQKLVRCQVIDFGCKVPFEHIPKLVEEGFTELDGIVANGNRKIRGHYQIARNCLSLCLRYKRCDMICFSCSYSRMCHRNSRNKQKRSGSRDYFVSNSVLKH